MTKQDTEELLQNSSLTLDERGQLLGAITAWWMSRYPDSELPHCEISEEVTVWSAMDVLHIVYVKSVGCFVVYSDRAFLREALAAGLISDNVIDYDRILEADPVFVFRFPRDYFGRSADEIVESIELNLLADVTETLGGIRKMENREKDDYVNRALEDTDTTGLGIFNLAINGTTVERDDLTLEDPTQCHVFPEFKRAMAGTVSAYLGMAVRTAAGTRRFRTGDKLADVSLALRAGTKEEGSGLELNLAGLEHLLHISDDIALMEMNGDGGLTTPGDEWPSHWIIAKPGMRHNTEVGEYIGDVQVQDPLMLFPPLEKS